MSNTPTVSELRALIADGCREAAKVYRAADADGLRHAGEWAKRLDADAARNDTLATS